MKISTILDQIADGATALPVFQRGYVWNRDQVRGLMDSLYRRHPVGSLLYLGNQDREREFPWGLSPATRIRQTPPGWSAANNDPLRHYQGQ